MIFPVDLGYTDTMETNVARLSKRLERVNTKLNSIEDAWPSSGPTAESSTLEFQFVGALPKYATEEVTSASQALLRLTGWKFMVSVSAAGGRDAYAIIDIFVNDQSIACVRFMEKTQAKSLRAAVNLFPQLVNNTITHLQKYPHHIFQSRRYAVLLQLRKKLNEEWFNAPETHGASVPGPYAYPYGVHSPGWPNFGGLQLGN